MKNCNIKQAINAGGSFEIAFDGGFAGQTMWIVEAKILDHRVAALKDSEGNWHVRRLETVAMVPSSTVIETEKPVKLEGGRYYFRGFTIERNEQEPAGHWSAWIAKKDGQVVNESSLKATVKAIVRYYF